MASDAAIAACFAILRGAGLPFPSERDVAAALPMGWRVTLEAYPDADVQRAVVVYLQTVPPPVWWPKAVEIAAIASMAHPTAPGRVASRPDFATLRRAYFDARAHGSHDVAARLPDDVRDAILAKLDAVGGMAALRRAMMAQGPYELNSLERAFNAAQGSALVRR